MHYFNNKGKRWGQVRIQIKEETNQLSKGQIISRLSLSRCSTTIIIRSRENQHGPTIIMPVQNAIKRKKKIFLQTAESSSLSPSSSKNSCCLLLIISSEHITKMSQHHHLQKSPSYSAKVSLTCRHSLALLGRESCTKAPEFGKCEIWSVNDERRL